MLRGLALSLAFISMQTAAFATVPLSKMGRATSLFSTQRQVAGAVGVAALATALSLSLTATGSSSVELLTAAQLGNEGVLAAGVVAFHAACALAALISLIGVLFALQLRSDAATAGLATSARPAAAWITRPSWPRVPHWRFALARRSPVLDCSPGEHRSDQLEHRIRVAAAGACAWSSRDGEARP
jgi:hypothetical protein